MESQQQPTQNCLVCVSLTLSSSAPLKHSLSAALDSLWHFSHSFFFHCSFHSTGKYFANYHSIRMFERTFFRRFISLEMFFFALLAYETNELFVWWEMEIVCGGQLLGYWLHRQLISIVLFHSLKFANKLCQAINASLKTEHSQWLNEKMCIDNVVYCTIERYFIEKYLRCCSLCRHRHQNRLENCRLSLSLSDHTYTYIIFQWHRCCSISIWFGHRQFHCCISWCSFFDAQECLVAASCVQAISVFVLQLIQKV